jgi:hypothetical protein
MRAPLQGTNRHDRAMRRRASHLASLGLGLGLALGMGACFDEPGSNNDSNCPVGEEGCSCLQNATCLGTLVCVQGVCMSDGGETAGDGDGEPGDGDGDPGETVVVDLFTEACGLTATWTSHTPDASPISCDAVGEAATGWMVRYPELTLGNTTFTKVIGITAPPDVSHFVRGLYNIDDVPNPSTLEFRADVLLRCADGQAQCVGQFGLAIAEGIPNGLYTILDDRSLLSGQAPISMSVSLAVLVTFSEPSVGLVGDRTEQAGPPSPEVLIVNPRLVLP